MTAPARKAPPVAARGVRSPEETKTLVHWLQPLVTRLWRDKTATKGADGNARWTIDPLTPEALALHVRGKAPRGVGLIVPGESTTRALALDFDSHKGEVNWPTMTRTASRVVAELQRRGMPAVVFRSGGGHGVHVWVLWADPQDAYSVRLAAFDALGACGLKNGTAGVHAGEVEVFPKQDAVPAGGYGNMIFLPFAGESALLEPLLGFVTEAGANDVLTTEWEFAQPVPLLERPPKPERAAPPVMSSSERERLRRAVAALPNIGEHELDYDAWRNVVFGIMEGCGGDDEGVALVHELSARSAKYDPTFIDAHVLPYVKPGGGVTSATVFAMARKHGWQEVGAEDFEDLGGLPASKVANDASAGPTFRVESLEEFLNVPPTRWLVHELLPYADEQGNTAIFFGKPGEAKTFLATDIALAVARAAPWRDRPTVGGRVVYVAAEGARPLAARVRAYLHHRGGAEGRPNIGFIRAAPNLFKSGDGADWAKLARDIGQAVLIVIDTMFATSPGAKLNDDIDANTVMGHGKALSAATGALVVFVHHAGKAPGMGPMGSTALLAHVETCIEVFSVKVKGERIRLAVARKVRDGVDGQEFPFVLRKVKAGEIDSAIVEHRTPLAAAVVDKLSPVQSKVYDAARRLVGDGNTGAPVGDVIGAAAASMIFDPAETTTGGQPKGDRRRDQARAALTALINKGALVHEADVVKLPGFSDLGETAPDLGD